MEKQVNELIKKIMNSKKINLSDLNDIIRLHKNIQEKKYVYKMKIDKGIYNNNLISDFDTQEDIAKQLERFEKQIKRIEMALRDKLKQININLNENYLNKLENMLFYRCGNADIKDLRLVNVNELAIIRENSIELGDLSYDANRLSAGMALQEEAYLTEWHKKGAEPNYCDPEEIFSDFYEEMNNKINKLKEDLNLLNRNVEMYFDRDLDSFYFQNLNTFRVILTELPNVIEIYEVDVIESEWIPKKVNGDSVKDFMEKIDFSLLKEDFMITDLKKRYKGKYIDDIITNLDIEMVLDKFKQSSFSLEMLVDTYNNLFSNNNCMLEENESAINRLKYITAEKYVEQGFEYEKAINYAETIFQTIQEYKKQIISAVNGENSFPEDSLIGTVKKIRSI